jgi:hypothetical protein
MRVLNTAASEIAVSALMLLLLLLLLMLLLSDTHAYYTLAA